MSAWFLNIPLAWWRALILRALATTPASYDAAAIDKFIATRRS